MIVARGETRNDSNGSDGLLTFLEEHGLDPALDPTDPVIQNTTGSETDKGHFGKHLFVDSNFLFLFFFFWKLQLFEMFCMYFTSK